MRVTISSMFSYAIMSTYIVSCHFQNSMCVCCVINTYKYCTLEITLYTVGLCNVL